MRAPGTARVLAVFRPRRYRVPGAPAAYPPITLAATTIALARRDVCPAAASAVGGDRGEIL